MIQKLAVLLGVLLITGLSTASHSAATGAVLTSGQTVYVPIYSHIYAGPRSLPVNLTATLSIRNTDPDHWIEITAVNYHASDGKLVKAYLKTPTRLSPLASTRFIIEEEDTTGGSGACFIVKWTAKRKVSEPIMEGVMITTRSKQGISFISRGKVIREDSP